MGLLASKKMNQKCAVCGCRITEKTLVDDLCVTCYRQTVNISAILEYLQNTSIENLNTIQKASVQMSKSATGDLQQSETFEAVHMVASPVGEALPVSDDKYYIIRKKTGERFWLPGVVNKIGKNSEMANIVISDNNTLSRCHALLEKMSDGIYLSDCDSKNGTRYNGIRLTSGQKVMINSGDSFFLANEILTLIKE